MQASSSHPDLPRDHGFTQYKAAGKLIGKKALITGGSSGIGRATAILFAMEGANVAISYLPGEEENADITKNEVSRIEGKSCHAFAADLVVPENCESLVHQAAAALDGLNIIVNNVGWQNIVDDITKISNEQWRRTFAVNIDSFFYICRTAMPYLRSGDSIVNMASIRAYIGHENLLDYSATKGAVISFTRALSLQQAPKGIRINAIAPGPVLTPLAINTLPAAALPKFGMNTPLGRVGQPSDIATSAVFLASDDSSYMTGQTLHPNGGDIING